MSNYYVSSTVLGASKWLIILFLLPLRRHSSDLNIGLGLGVLADFLKHISPTELCNTTTTQWGEEDAGAGHENLTFLPHPSEQCDIEWVSLLLCTKDFL